MSMAAIFLIGLGFGAIYPTGMAMLTTAHPDNPGQAGSLITAMASIGGVIIPWLQGVVMEKTSIRGGYLYGGCVDAAAHPQFCSQSAGREEYEKINC